MADIRIKLTKSLIGSKQDQIATLLACGRSATKPFSRTTTQLRARSRRSHT